MAQAKRSRRTPASSQPTTTPSGLLLRVFRTVAGQPQEISVFDGSGSAEIRVAGPPDADRRWRRFDRLVIVTGPTSPPLVFDVIPDNDSVIELETRPNRSTLTLRCKIRCVIAQRDHITFNLQIEKANRRLKYSRVSFQGPFAIPRPSPQPVPQVTTELDLYPSPQPGVNPFPTIIAHDSDNRYKIDLESRGFNSTMAETLGLRFTAPEAAADNVMHLFFERICPPAGECAFGVVFTASRPDRLDVNERSITIFVANGSEPVRIRVRKSEADSVWRITQQPSRSLTGGRKQGPAIWNITLEGIPARAAYELWNSYVEEYWLSLDTVRGGNPVSLLPALHAPQGNTPWEIAFVIRDPTNRENPDYAIGEAAAGDVVSILGRRLEPVKPYTAQFQLGQVMTYRNEALILQGPLGKVPVTNDDVPSPPLLRLELTDVVAGLVGAEATSRLIRLGALDITIGTQPPSGNNVRPFYELQFRETLFVELNTHIYVERITPGGQDDIPGQEFVAQGEGLTLEDNESVDPCAATPPATHPNVGSEQFERCVDAGFRPKRPIVIAAPNATTSPNDRLFLSGREVAKSRSSQTVTLNLRNLTPGSGAQTSDQAKVIVLDSSPFMVAEVRFTPFSRQVSTGSNIANWTNGGIEGAGWQLLQTGEGPTDLILPSQGIGEQMERGYPHNLGPNATGPGYTIKEGDLVDFRLSPPARLSINVGEHQQRFIEAPWNLRRVLGFPGQRTPGARVRHLQFELLYGLSCDVRTPFLRLAEITSLLGAVPGRLGREPAWMPMTKENIDVNGARYQESRFDWSVLHRRFLSRLAILEPWDSHVRDSLILSEDVQCLIRNVRHVVPNSPILEPADLANPVDPTVASGLKGGVTWGFESKNVYNAVMRPEGQNPLSTSASVADLYFSSLGGYGRLVAGFDKDRSKIYDDVALGRTYSYKLERIGRIACWWNRAKHVIVYERTVLPSKQFDGQQPRHAGRPIVRKVREYIKILDEKRNYPDSETEVSQTEQAALEKRRGFVAACSFPPGAEIPVDSSWGTDVEDIGWKVPLWNPAAAAAKPTVYPKPVISPHLFSDVGGVSQPVPVVISEPQNVYFYTDTRADTSGDPNEWPPIKGVDYVDCPLPRPQVDFRNGNPQQTTPADTLVPAGFGPCTFRLDPPPVPSDLVAARAGKPLSAALDSVTMVRAQLKELIPNPDAITARFQETLLLGTRLREPLGDILGRLPSEGTVSIGQLTTHLNNSFNVGGEFTRFFDALDARCNDLSSEIQSIERLIRKREAELFSGLESQLVKLLDDRRQAFLNDVNEVLGNTGLDLNARKAALLIVVDQNIATIQNSLLLLRLSPGLLQKAVVSAAGSAARLINESEQRIQSVLNRINQYAVTLTAEQLEELKNLTRELIRQVDLLFSLFNIGVSPSLEPWLPDPLSYIINNNPVTTNGPTPRALIDQWKAALETNILQAQVLTRDAALQALALQNSWIETVRTAVQGLGNRATDHVSAWRDNLVADLPIKEPFHIENQLAVLRAHINSATSIDFPQLANSISNMLGNQIAGVATHNLRATLTPVRDLLQGQITNATDPALGLLQYIQGAAGHLCDQIKNRAALKDKLLAAINSSNEARAIANAIRQTVDQFHGTVTQYADAAMNLIQRNDQWPKLREVYSAGNTALGVIRAFGKPPVVPNMTFERPALAYFYKELNDRVDLTPVLSTVAKASAVADALKPLGISLPTEGLVEKLVPPDLKNFDLSKIFPDFAGLNLKHLFPNLKMPAAANDNVKVSHGADPQTRRAWIDVDINFPMDRPATLFSIGPVSIRIVNSRFEAKARVEAGLAGEPPKRTVRGAIIGDWELTVGGQTIVIFRRTEVRFDESGKLRFSVDPRNLEMPGILSFLQDFMKKFSDSNSGLTIGFAPGGVQAVLNLPIPDVQIGAFGLSNLRVGALLRVTVIGDDGFAIAVGFNVGRKLAPFALVIFILGGGGYLEVESRYVPAKRQITCLVQLGITACASLAIALGPIKGGVYVYFGITAEFRSGQGGGLTIGVMFLIRGEVSILGIVEACVSLLLEAKYSSGRLIGHGNLSIKIKICWCFTLEVSEDVTYELAGGGGGSASLQHPELNGLLAFNSSGHPSEAGEGSGYFLPAPPSEHYIEFATKYIELLA